MPTAALTERPFSPSVVQRACSCDGPKRAGGDSGGCGCSDKGKEQASPTSVPAVVHRALASPAAPLPAGTRRSMESAFGSDFSGVRVHAGGDAARGADSIDSRAFTVGSDIVFGDRQFAPASAEGRRLLAHELAHVVQNRAGRGGGPVQRDALRLGSAGSPTEREADAAAARVMGGQSATRARSADDAGPGVVRRALMCSRPIQTSALVGTFFNHAWIDDTPAANCNHAGQEGNYAVMELAHGTSEEGCALKTTTSPDPAGGRTNAKRCVPRPGVGNVSACLRAAHAAYQSPGYYSTTRGVIPGGIAGALFGGLVGGLALGVALGPLGAVLGGLGGAILGGVGGLFASATDVGPNSNTYAGTLARACCANADTDDLGLVPGWDKPAAGPCPPEVARQPPRLP